jgi:hypothetical protein
MCGDCKLKLVAIFFWEVMLTFHMNLILGFEPSRHFTSRKGNNSYEYEKRWNFYIGHKNMW